MTVTIAEARKTLKQRAVKRRRHLEELAREAGRDVAAIARMLVARYRPKRIYQWGSLLDSASFREWSDIDLALEGLEDPLDGLRAADDAAQMTRFPVDIVELERIDDRHARDIRAHGKLIYEQTDD